MTNAVIFHDHATVGVQEDVLNRNDAQIGTTIFQITRTEAGKFEATEGCDGYYSANLTREQLFELADKLRELAKR